jgi:DnaK suppressor protein
VNIMANITDILVATAHAIDTTHEQIRRTLLERRRQLMNEIECKIRDVREEGTTKCRLTVDPGDTTEVAADDDLAFALLQMKAQVLTRINEAMQRLDDGTYGYCVECDDAIAPQRLRALPFAVRCKDCEEQREHAHRDARVQARRGSSAPVFDIRH